MSGRCWEQNSLSHPPAGSGGRSRPRRSAAGGTRGRHAAWQARAVRMMCPRPHSCRVHVKECFGGGVLQLLRAKISNSRIMMHNKSLSLLVGFDCTLLYSSLILYFFNQFQVGYLLLQPRNRRRVRRSKGIKFACTFARTKYSSSTFF